MRIDATGVAADAAAPQPKAKREMRDAHIGSACAIARPGTL